MRRGIIILIFVFSCTKKDVQKDVSSSLVPRPACFYYSYPSLVNGARGDVELATTNFENFKLLVFGDGLQQASHPDHPKTREIVARLKSTGKAVYGYIDAGVSTGNLSLETVQKRIAEWKALGSTGIFFDTFGYDYRVSRERQVALVNLVRNAGLSLMVNVWQAQDVLEGNSPLREGDVFVSEAFLIGEGRLFDVLDWKAKQDYLNEKKKEMGFEVLALAAGGAKSTAEWSTMQTFLWAGAIVAESDYFYFSDNNYGATTSQVYEFDDPYKLPETIQWQGETEINTNGEITTIQRTSNFGQFKLSYENANGFSVEFNK